MSSRCNVTLTFFFAFLPAMAILTGWMFGGNVCYGADVQLSLPRPAKSSHKMPGFGDFPAVGQAQLSTPVQDISIANTARRHVTRIHNGIAPEAPSRARVLGDLYLADDRPLVAGDSAQLLASTAALLHSDPDSRLTLEAYCDERGAETYGLVIGQQWLAAVNTRLEEMGVRGMQIDAVSYGTQQPACKGYSTACWEDNLRMRWSIHLLSPVMSQRGCLVRLRFDTTAMTTSYGPILEEPPYLRRIQQGEAAQ
jgi:outer membrane protein OmpA-like peptidoglycan-associated protein